MAFFEDKLVTSWIKWVSVAEGEDVVISDFASAMFVLASYLASP